MKLSLLFLTPLLWAGATASFANAQVPYQNQFANHGGSTLTGGPGNTHIYGGPGPDKLSDPSPGDNDVIWDNVGLPDFSRDTLDTTDGDNGDVMYGGPNDTFCGDDGDMIHIRSVNVGQPIWSGTVREYKCMRAILEWVRLRYSELHALFVDAGAEGGPTEHDALFAAVWDLLQVEVDDASAKLVLADLLPIAKYELAEPLPSPGGFATWAPVAETPTPVEDQLALELTGAEYEAALDDLIVLLAHAYASPLQL